MSNTFYSDLQLREVFHLEFLRYLSRKIKPDCFSLKGGVNLRLFFKSIRYSEDMDLDAKGIGVHKLRDSVMDILRMPAFQAHLKPFGIKEIVPPAIERAKQTQTTQRFKIHLITSQGVDLFTKIEFSRRGMLPGVLIEPPSEHFLSQYKLGPLLIPHYDTAASVLQKLKALAGRKLIQARDIFDLYILSSQYSSDKAGCFASVEKIFFSKAYENIFEVSFEVFRDTVIAYLLPEDQPLYKRPDVWETIKLKVAGFLKQLEKEYA